MVKKEYNHGIRLVGIAGCWYVTRKNEIIGAFLPTRIQDAKKFAKKKELEMEKQTKINRLKDALDSAVSMGEKRRIQSFIKKLESPAQKQTTKK